MATIEQTQQQQQQNQSSGNGAGNGNGGTGPGRGGGGGVGAPVTQLEFNQAMTDFKTMFPDLDEDVIEVVLRSNNGAVDSTIDQLLTMSVDSENEKLRSEFYASESNDEVPPQYSPATPPPSYQQAVPQQQLATANSPIKVSNLNGCGAGAGAKLASQSNSILHGSLTMDSSFSKRSNNHHLPSIGTLKIDSSKFEAVRNSSGKPLMDKFRWKPPLIGQLPPSFLRLEYEDELTNPNRHHHIHHKQRSTSYDGSRKGSDVSVLSSAMLQQKMEENERQRQLSRDTLDPETAQYLEDERVAIFLQNEEFVQELRRNKDFMSTLELDSSSTVRGPNGELTDLGAAGGATGGHSTDSDAAFKETLKNMGKASRKKFAQLARLFSRRKRPSFPHLLGGHGDHSGNPSRDNLLSTNDDEYQQLENEGSDTEERRSNSWDSHGGGDAGGITYSGRNLSTANRAADYHPHL